MHIIQKQSNDCGIAALAMLFGTSYSYMRKVAMADFRDRGISFDGMYDQDFQSIAARMDDRMRVWRVGPKNRTTILKRLDGRKAILICPGRGPNPEGWVHAVYWDGLRVRDPSPAMKYAPTGQTALPALLRALVLDSDR